MSEQAEQREHQATDKRLTELRERGDTLRSKDLSGGLTLGTAIIAIVFMSSSYFTQFENNFIYSFHNIKNILNNENQFTIVFRNVCMNNLLVLIPLLTILYGMAFASVFLLGGWNFSLKAIKFNFDKLNPFNNLKMIFSSRLFIDMAKSFAKLLIIAICFYYFIHSNKEVLLSLSYLKFDAIIRVFFTCILHFTIVIIMGVIVIMAIDVMTNYYNYQSKTKMTTQELKDEYKETEGNVDIKRKLRSLQMALAKQKIPQMVPKATVVITNPTHYAVALQYKEGKDHAPKVIAKGKGSVAAYIRRIAIQNGVPLYEEPPLARALFHTTKLGGLINPGLYMAVAIVLTYINQVRRYQSGLGPLPEKQTNLAIPPEFAFKE